MLTFLRLRIVTQGQGIADVDGDDVPPLFEKTTTSAGELFNSLATSLTIDSNLSALKAPPSKMTQQQLFLRTDALFGPIAMEIFADGVTYMVGYMSLFITSPIDTIVQSRCVFCPKCKSCSKSARKESRKNSGYFIFCEPSPILISIKGSSIGSTVELLYKGPQL